jgi:rubrerythrin
MNIIAEILGGLLGGGMGPGSAQPMNSTVAAVDAAQAKTAANDAKDKAYEIRDRFDHLTLLCMAMWELMKQSGLTDEQLAAKVKEIDLADSKLDGRYTPSLVSQCPQCGHVMSRRHGKCMYCGHENLETKPFDAV